MADRLPNINRVAAPRRAPYVPRIELPPIGYVSNRPQRNPPAHRRPPPDIDNRPADQRGSGLKRRISPGFMRWIQFCSDIRERQPGVSPVQLGQMWRRHMASRS